MPNNQVPPPPTPPLPAEAPPPAESLVAALVMRALNQEVMTRQQLAEALGIHRSSLWRKLASLDPGILRRTASITGLHYPQLLRAALVDAGLATADELIDGLRLSAVIRIDSDTDVDDVRVVAAFADDDLRAREHADIAATIYKDDNPYGGLTGFHPVRILVNTNETIEHVTVHTASWNNRTDTVTVTPQVFQTTPGDIDPTTGLGSIHCLVGNPSGLGSLPTSVGLNEDLGNVVGITSARLTATTPQAARQTLADAVSALRADGRLAPPPLPVEPTPPSNPIQSASAAYTSALTPTYSETKEAATRDAIAYATDRYVDPHANSPWPVTIRTSN